MTSSHCIRDLTMASQMHVTSRQPQIELSHHPIMSAEAIEEQINPVDAAAGEAAVFEETKASLEKA